MIKVVPAQTSILECEIFQPDPEQEREMYLRMFSDNYNPSEMIDNHQATMPSEIPNASYQNPFDR